MQFGGVEIKRQLVSGSGCHVRLNYCHHLPTLPVETELGRGAQRFQAFDLAYYLKEVFFRLLMVNGLILLLWFFIPITFKGEPLFAIWPLTGTKEGIIHAAAITIKSNATIMTLMAFLTTMPVFTLGRAMRYFHMPDKIIHLLSFTYRYIHVIHMEYRRLMNAIKIRGFNPGNNIHTYKTYAYLVGMLLLKSYERADRVRAAMLCRGFKGRFYNLSEFSFKSSDWVIMVFVLLAISALGLLQWTRIIY